MKVHKDVHFVSEELHNVKWFWYHLTFKPSGVMSQTKNVVVCNFDNVSCGHLTVECAEMKYLILLKNGWMQVFYVNVFENENMAKYINKRGNIKSTHYVTLWFEIAPIFFEMQGFLT